MEGNVRSLFSPGHGACDVRRGVGIGVRLSEIVDVQIFIWGRRGVELQVSPGEITEH